MNLVDDFQSRGLFHQSTDEASLRKALASGVVTGYIGFDPTAASLHVGHLLQVLNLVRLQRAGHRPIAVVGGGTGLIGDPSGKQAERTLLTRESLDVNLAALRAQLGRYLDFDASKPNAAVMVDNAEWLTALNYVEFLRDVGKHFSVNAMVQRDAVKDRLTREQGLSYTEFSYMLLQSYDFVALYDRYGCTLQLGGSDQWGNIVSGVDLVRRMRDAESHGLTVRLITTASGAKMGKTEKGAVWLDPALTSPYEFYQYWFNTHDADVERFLAYFTFLTRAEIDAVMDAQRSDPSKREGQRRLAAELTRFVHGEAALAEATRAAKGLFGVSDWRALSQADIEGMVTEAPRSDIAAATLGTPEAGLVAVLVQAGLYPSKSQARTGVEQGGVSVNDVVEKNPQRVLGPEDVLAGGYVVLRKGKKHYHVLCAR